MFHNQPIMLKHLVSRYRFTKKLLESHKDDSHAKEILEKQLIRHANDIVEYVTSDHFQTALNNLNL